MELERLTNYRDQLSKTLEQYKLNEKRKKYTRSYTKRYRKLDSILRPNKLKVKRKKSKTDSLIFTAG